MARKNIRDSDIDFSDIPEIKDFSGFHAVYEPRKVAVNRKLDADVVAWLKKDGKGYQTRMNAILREMMEKELTTRFSDDEQNI
ncbi:MAG: BrnA antitoxin family protein [Sphaerochaetaceae bacterium]|nr:BrnA antitoxin family protein [Sphaerochaetaceae bacterium]